MITGLFLCRGDLSSEACRDCVSFSVTDIVARCQNQREATIYYDECMLRYSDRNIFSNLTLTEDYPMYNDYSVQAKDEERFKKLALTTMIETAIEAANSTRYFCTRKTKGVIELRELYVLVQCTPDLTREDCLFCLLQSINNLNFISIGSRYLFPSCNSRYELYPFYNDTQLLAPPPLASSSPPVSSALPPPPPPRKGGNSNVLAIAILVAIILALLLFIAGYCILTKRKQKASNNAPAFYGDDITTIDSLQLDYRTIQAATDDYSENNKIGRGGFGEVYKLQAFTPPISKHFGPLCLPPTPHTPPDSKCYVRTSPDMITGLFLCRGDLSSEACRDCVSFSVTDIVARCQNQREATIYYDECMLRYSDRNIFSNLTLTEDYPMYNDYSVQAKDEERFKKLALTTMIETAIEAANSTRYFCTRKTKGVIELRELYVLVQCTPDLTREDCLFCLLQSINNLNFISIGSRYLFPSCNSRYELYPFYNDTQLLAPPPLASSSPPVSSALPPPPPPRKGGNSNVLAIAILVAIILALLLFIAGYCILTKRKQKASNNAPAFYGDDITTIDSLQLDYRTIQAATDDYSENNKIGRGGFGEVYKAWRLWTNKTELELVDPVIVDKCQKSEVVRCIHVGLLCVQEDPVERPTFSTILLMLTSNNVTLPVPQQPGFVIQAKPKKDLPDSNQSTMTRCAIRSVSDASVTDLYPR
ncbi:hypothetical protein Bca4012_015034 [Brassica carinata]